MSAKDIAVDDGAERHGGHRTSGGAQHKDSGGVQHKDSGGAHKDSGDAAVQGSGGATPPREHAVSRVDKVELMETTFDIGFGGPSSDELAFTND